MEHARPLAERTAASLIEYIVGNSLQTGDKLPNEYDLAKRMGVGRSTVREAVKALVTRHILEVRQGAGTFVAKQQVGVPDDPLGFAFIENKQKLIMDLLEIRMLLEPRIAATAAVQATAEDIDELYTLCGEVEKQIQQGQSHVEPDIAFHVKIAQSSRNLVAPNLIPIIQNAISLFVCVTNRELQQETIETHRMIVQGIAMRDALAASDAMSMHILYNRNLMRAMFREQAGSERAMNDLL